MSSARLVRDVEILIPLADLLTWMDPPPETVIDDGPFTTVLGGPVGTGTT